MQWVFASLPSLQLFQLFCKKNVIIRTNAKRAVQLYTIVIDERAGFMVNESGWGLGQFCESNRCWCQVFTVGYVCHHVFFFCFFYSPMQVGRCENMWYSPYHALRL